MTEYQDQFATPWEQRRLKRARRIDIPDLPLGRVICVDDRDVLLDTIQAILRHGGTVPQEKLSDIQHILNTRPSQGTNDG